MMPTAIVCAACSAEFEFSAEEQEFYQSKGFTAPKKCKPCRDAAKQSRQNNGFSSGYGRPERQLHDAVCAGCNVQTQVPFKPNGSKPVYCRDCFNSKGY